MPRKRTPTLTQAELRVMSAVWELGSATVHDVLATLPSKSPLAYTTILTTMRILEDKGYLSHRKEGRAYVYYPRISRAQAQRKAVQHVVRSLFDGSPESLVLNVLKNEKLTPDELDRLKKILGEFKA